MMSESVLACSSENHTCPLVSSAAIRDSLGVTNLSVAVAGLSDGAHILRLYWVWFTQDSSILMIRLPSYSIITILSEYYWRSTRQRSEFACTGMPPTLLYPSRNSLRMILHIYCVVSSRLWVSLIFYYMTAEFHIGLFYDTISSTISATISLVVIFVSSICYLSAMAIPPLL